MKKCTRCGVTRSVADFYTKRAEAGGKAYASSYCKECDKKRLHDRIKRLRVELIAFGGGRCKKCGYDKFTGALEFHHRDSLEKEFNINTIRSLNEKAKKELEKCDLLCANCHREAHFKERSN